MDLEFSANVIRNLKYALENASTDSIREWIDWCVHYIDLFTKVLQKVGLSVAEKQHIQGTIANLHYFHEKFKERQVSGAGASSSRRRKVTDRVRWKDMEAAFQGRIKTGAVVNLHHKDVRSFLNDAKILSKIRLNNVLKYEGNIKVNAILAGKFQAMKDGETIEEMKHFNTRNEMILPGTNLEEWFNDNIIDPILEKVEDFQERDSGWTLIEIVNLVININSYVPFVAGFSTYRELPPHINAKRAIVNIQNDDEYCFLWCVVAALHPVADHAYRTSLYPHYTIATIPGTDRLLNYQGITFPIAFHDIPKFEKINQLAINVYGVARDGTSAGNIVPFYLSNIESAQPTIHLFLMCTDAFLEPDRQPIYHYALIRNLSRLVSSQISYGHRQTRFCDRCLCHFRIERSYENHRQDCFAINKCKMILPTDENKIASFKNYKFKETVPFVVYADLECILESVANDDTLREKHIPHSVAYYLHCAFDSKRCVFNIKRGPDCIKWFMEELEKIGQMVYIYLLHVVSMDALTAEQAEEFKYATVCHICEKPINPEDVKVCDHCHFTGKYRGPAHQACNLNYKSSHDIPVVFHNLSGYDSHFLIKDLATSFRGALNLLPVNKQKYIAFKKSLPRTNINLRFIDSYRFMASSLEKLASNLKDVDKKITRGFCNDEEEKFRLLTRKGVFPYEYVDSWEKLEDQVLPPREAFFSKLTNEEVLEEDYAHAQKVWDTFEISTLGEYSDLYLKTDVLLLADVFENFRSNCFSVYKLDPLHYFTAPGLAFDAMLKCTGVELELLTDCEKLLFIEKGIRGGVAQCTNRYAAANNHYMPDDQYDATKEESYLMYFDVNNLYGAAMSEYLPYGAFEWYNEENFNVFEVADDSSFGYILEVDLEYPRDLHESHRDLPLCPEHFVPPGGKSTKLMTTLLPKKSYVIHYKNLKQCLSLGLQLTKIHRILKFKQAPWLKPYIDLNTERRKHSTNEFQKNFFKLMNNAVFGKTMENVRKQKDVKLISEWHGRYGARARIAQPNFHSSIIFDDDENLVIIELNRTDIIFNKPIYVGFCILDLSKILLYDFHYNYIKRVFGENAKLLYTDTDSLLYCFYKENIYDFIKRDIEKFDTSDYPIDNGYGIPLMNKKVIGLMKDECNGKIMTEFVGLRAKMYSFKLLGEEEEKKRAKGVRGATLKSITFEDYKNCLFEGINVVRDQYLIQSKNHSVHTVLQKKLALSSSDDKRVLLSDSTDTVPYGYK